jgi:pantoate--beta-alanine ligase
MPAIARSLAELRALLRAPARTAMVPTMGALHDGHLSLVRRARDLGTRVVVSIFVNPAQFAPNEDFDAYPRTFEADVAKLEGLADIVFAPIAREMYPEGFATTVTVGGPSAGLESDFRPHFFAGVATIVAKLLLAAMPDAAVFGEKDYQQLLVVKRLAKDLGLATEIVGAPTLREADGLAMSSRNAYLDVRERAVAARLNAILKDVIARSADVRAAEAWGAEALRAAGFDGVDYVAIRDAETLAAVERVTGPARVLAAARIGRTRLIDNMPL